MQLNIKQVDYIANWFTASGVDFKGRNIFGAGSTVLEAITNALKS